MGPLFIGLLLRVLYSRRIVSSPCSRGKNPAFRFSLQLLIWYFRLVFFFAWLLSTCPILGVFYPPLEPREDSLPRPHSGGAAVVHLLHLPGGLGERLQGGRERQEVSFRRRVCLPTTCCLVHRYTNCLLSGTLRRPSQPSGNTAVPLRFVFFSASFAVLLLCESRSSSCRSLLSLSLALRGSHGFVFLARHPHPPTTLLLQGRRLERAHAGVDRLPDEREVHGSRHPPQARPRHPRRRFRHVRHSTRHKITCHFAHFLVDIIAAMIVVFGLSPSRARWLARMPR